MEEQLTIGLVVDRVPTIARRPKTESELSDSTCTPAWLCDMLPEVDTDPCSNPRSHVRARRTFSLEKGLDGLKLPWWRGREFWKDPTKRESGSVFENFPYSNPLPFCEKTIEEIRLGNCHEVIVLCKLDPTPQWWKTISSWDPILTDTKLPLAQPPDLWLFDRRVQHDEHPELIELRKQKRIAKGKPHLNGKSSSNFASAIIHHRGYPRVDGKVIGDRVPPLNLLSVASLWRQPRAE